MQFFSNLFSEYSLRSSRYHLATQDKSFLAPYFTDPPRLICNMQSSTYMRRSTQHALTEPPKKTTLPYCVPLPTIDHFSSLYHLTFHGVTHSKSPLNPKQREGNRVEARRKYERRRKVGSIDLDPGVVMTGKQMDKGNGEDETGQVFSLQGNNGGEMKEKESIIGRLAGEEERVSNGEEITDSDLSELSPLMAVKTRHSSVPSQNPAFPSSSLTERKRACFLFESKQKVLFRPRILNRGSIMPVKSCISLPSVSPFPSPNKSRPMRTKPKKHNDAGFTESTQLQMSLDNSASLSNIMLPSQTALMLPVLHLKRIESRELDTSDTDINPNASIHRKRKPQLRRLRMSVGDDNDEGSHEQIMTDYMHDTADVLDDTKTILKRRNERMVIPARLLKITPMV